MTNNTEIIYKDLSYKIMGMAFKIFNELNYGMKEKYYQRAFITELETNNIKYEKEKFITLSYKNQIIGKYFIDLLIDDKIIIELKTRPALGYIHIKQVMEYLNKLNKKNSKNYNKEFKASRHLLKMTLRKMNLNSSPLLLIKLKKLLTKLVKKVVILIFSIQVLA